MFAQSRQGLAHKQSLKWMIKILDIYVLYVVFKILVSGYYVIMAIPINQKHQIPQNGTF